MLVIEGRRGKSRILQEIINKNSNKNILAFVDSIEVIKFMWGMNLYFTNIAKEGMCKNIIIDHLNAIRKFDIIILAINDDKKMLNKYQQLEKLINKKCIVTIQNNKLKNIKIYEK